jgi:hypothetical protein
MHAMKAFTDMGADAADISEVAETEAHAVEKVSTHDAGTHTLTAVGHAEAETVEAAVLMGTTPEDVIEAVHVESDAMELASPMEIESMVREADQVLSDAEAQSADHVAPQMLVESDGSAQVLELVAENQKVAALTTESSSTHWPLHVRLLVCGSMLVAGAMVWTARRSKTFWRSRSAGSSARSQSILITPSTANLSNML